MTGVKVVAEFVGGPEDGKQIVVDATEQCVPVSSVIEFRVGIKNPAWGEDAPWEPPFLGYETVRYRRGEDIAVDEERGLIWYFRMEEGT